MPCVSEFFGIAVYMYYDEHNPPHFHAKYGGEEIQISIAELATLRGRLPRRAQALVLEWADLHRAELLANWELARNRRPLAHIEPLE